MHPGRDPGNWIARRGLPHRAAPRCVTPDLRTEMRCARIRRRRGTTDRKSTRLNSSHGYISYAVFCLQKKIMQQTPETDQFAGAPRGIRAAQLPDGNVANAFLHLFGKQQRTEACESERDNGSNMHQAL